MHRILVAGIDAVMDKLCYCASALREHGIDTIFYSEDRVGQSAEVSASHGFTFHRTRPGGFLRLLRGVDHVELYLGSRPWNLAGYLAAMRARGVPFITCLRGGEIADWRTSHPLRRAVTRAILGRAAVTILKEPEMERELGRERIATRARHVLHNRVPIGPPPRHDLVRSDVVFFNSFRPMRRVDRVLETAALVRRTHPAVRFRVIGATGEHARYAPVTSAHERSLRDLAQRLHLGDVFEPFRTDARPFDTAAIFLLPADRVFCNFSLLEAMERGVVPVVADVDGAERIIADGVNGFLVPQNAEAMAAKVRLLLDDPVLREAMSRAARETIVTRFDVRATAAELVEHVYPAVWSDRG